MIITVIEYGGTPRKIECESFEFRCNHVTNWIKIKKADGAEEIIKDICVIKAESEEQGMTQKEHDKIIHLISRGALQGIDTGRLDGKCEDVIPLEDAIAIVDLVYKAESEG